jgi:hypothetical protein
MFLYYEAIAGFTEREPYKIMLETGKVTGRLKY